MRLSTWIRPIRTVVAATLLSSATPPALAGGDTPLWISNASGSWFDAANWVLGITPEPGLGPSFGDGLGFEDPTDVVDIDNGGNGVSQPGDTLRVFDKVQFVDGGAGGDAALADDGMVFDQMRLDGAGGQPVIFDVPVTARLLESVRHGAVFNREISVTEIVARSKHQDKWEINGGTTGSIGRMLLDEARGPDGDTIDGAVTVNASLQVNLLEHVWGNLRVGPKAQVVVDHYVYNNYRALSENNNINPIHIDGILRAARFTMVDLATETESDLAVGTHGRISHPGADFEHEFITGEGLLVVRSNQIFRNSFEAVSQ